MLLPRASAIAARLDVLESTGSTNDELRVRATGPEPWPHLSAVATDNQTAGRGRLGRVWAAPPGTSLALSVLLRPGLPLDALGWLPLLAGLAVVRTLRGVGADASLKWPNDVHIEGRKVCGILTELLPDASGVLVGIGVNLTLQEDELPVPTATSLALAGVPADADAVAAGTLAELRDLVAALAAAGGDADASGVRAAVSGACGTLGRSVRVELPSGEVLRGTATGIDGHGRLEVLPEGGPQDAGVTAVSAGDVTHLRY
ncbi:biotin--[acetyl-CoA-carboxylase] ligase [Naasia sp. SYSU D00057]|uniref:biotin--[acetyl-CoA-carboxylase] ligase n=1 Tax=Naasia sp. SYSU D00057 TaxID=2817380 RepID=UPI001B302846|nr:biotin--[acetyl-CoA-carboxylase] ligase [Naasia sp. SYSU D00057]